MDISVAVRCRFVAVGIRFDQNDRPIRDHLTLTNEKRREEGEIPDSISPFFMRAPVRIAAIPFARSLGDCRLHAQTDLEQKPRGHGRKKPDRKSRVFRTQARQRPGMITGGLRSIT